MTKYIGQTAVPTVQTVTIGAGREIEENDMIDEDDTNYFFLGSEDAKQLSLEFTLTVDTHPAGLTVEEQREEIKSLVSSPEEENNITINGKQGYYSIESVNVPESGSEATIVKGTIEGRFLPWPKNAPTRPPYEGNSVILHGSLSDLALTMEGELSVQEGGSIGEAYGSNAYGDGDYGN